MTARYVVGIDLGTTHSAVAFAPLGDDASPGDLQVLPLPQLVARGLVEPRTLLPSFVYLAHESDGKQALPWDSDRRFAVGEYARSRGVDTPSRLVSSAKSWLCHTGIDRRASVLPPGAPEDVERISAVEASFRYLEHVTEVWDQRFGREDGGLKLAEQEVVLTVPASFDAAARELTVEAALAAGIEHLTLLEEPQAALYAFIHAAGERWREELRVGDVLLVVDVGGGTSDFSVIAAVPREGALELVRVAVGDHILLGGDNMDLAVAHVVRAKLQASGRELDRWQMSSLTHACRAAKERLLAEGGPETVPIVIPGRGSQLLGGAIRTELTREEAQRTVVEGFFPAVPLAARPAARPRTGLTQIGLPYASDPAITTHLAAFLGRQADAMARLPGIAPSGSPGRATSPLLCPTAVLFNGGVMKGELLRERVIATLDRWLKEAGAPPVRVLTAPDLDLSVARGAASYALARRGRGLRIRGGTARAYYVGIESPAPAVPGIEAPLTAMCLAPFGMEEGSEAGLPSHELGVVVGEPVRFRFFGSSVRRQDVAGTILESWGPSELEELAPIEITLPAKERSEGDVVPVRLHAALTEIGTLKLEAVPLHPIRDDERWDIELNVRSQGAT
jgi:Hsp70 protein